MALSFQQQILELMLDYFWSQCARVLRSMAHCLLTGLYNPQINIKAYVLFILW